MCKKSVLTIISILAICIFSGIARADLVAWYEFEGNANDSAGSYNATFKGGAATVGDAQRGEVLSLNGSDAWVECPTSFSFVTATDQKAIMAWVKPNTTDYGMILDLYRRYDSTSGFLIEVAHNTGTWNSRYINSSKDWQDIDSEVLVEASSWTHIALVQDGANVIYYINGAIAGQADNGGIPTLNSPINASIGAYIQGYPVGFFNGCIDDLRIYNNALTQSEVQAIAEVPEPITLILFGAGALMINRRIKS